MASSTRDAYRLGRQDAKEGRARRTLDSKIQPAYEQGYSDGQSSGAPQARTHRVVRAKNVQPFRLG